MDALRFLVSLLFPPRAEEVLVASIHEDILRTLLSPREERGVRTLYSYTDERVRALVWEAKYHHNRHALALIGAALRAEAHRINPTALIVPIPLSARRRTERGYNQVEEALGTAVCTPHALIRMRETVPQTHLARAARLTNLVGAFAVPPAAAETVRDRDILLVDDVTTTGATLSEATRTLLRARARSVQCLAFARS